MPDGLIAPVPALPANWEQGQMATRAIGDHWLAEAIFPTMWVPSALVPLKRNCLLNPEHFNFDLGWIVAWAGAFHFRPPIARGIDSATQLQSSRRGRIAVAYQISTVALESRPTTRGPPPFAMASSIDKSTLRIAKYYGC